MLKKFNVLQSLILAVLALLCQVSFAQNVGINSTGTAPDASAGLDVSFTDRGFLAPRMTLAQRGLISNPAKGLLVYQTDGVAGFYYNSGTSASPVWVILNTGTSGWSSTGNSSTTAGTNFLGTTDAVDFVIKTNNTERARFLSSGYVGIGTTTPAAPLHVSSTSGNILYLQSTTGGSGTQASIAFKTYGGTTYPTGLISAVDNNYSSYFAFFTKIPGADANPLSERMRITTTGEVAIGTTSPDASAKLDITSASQGLLLPRVTLNSTTDLTTVPIRTNSLLVYNSATANDVTPGFYYWNSTLWTRLSTGGVAATSPWTTSGTNIYNNNTGNVNIGTSTFAASNPYKFLVDAGTTTSYNLMGAKGSYDNYLQLNVQNTSSGTSASSDIVASNSLATDANDNYYIDMGINSNAYTLNTNPILNGFSTAYLYNKGGDLAIGTGTAGKILKFFTNGTATTDEKMRITSDGNVGIGLNGANPSYKLHIGAASNPLFMSGVQTGATTDSLLTINAGVVKKLLPASSSLWSINGNSNIDSLVNFMGTTNNQAVVFKANNTETMRITKLNKVVVGGMANYNNTLAEKFIVDGGGDYNNVMGVYADIDGYAQIGVQNLSSANNASSDIVATADNGTDESNYIDLGINSSSYTNNKSNILNKPNLGYLYANSAANFKIGNGGLGKSLVFFTNPSTATLGTLTANGIERFRITGDGNVGIGDFTAPSTAADMTVAEKLTVEGNIAPRYNAGEAYPSIGTFYFNLGSSTYHWNTIYANNIGNTILPGSDNAYDFGSTAFRWKNIYATNTTIQTSDRRLKTNIEDLKYGLKEIMALKPVSFNWKETPDSDNKIGLIAQDTRKVIPEVVYGDESKENIGIGYSDLIPVLINAIKEQQKQIDELKQQVQKLQK